MTVPSPTYSPSHNGIPLFLSHKNSSGIQRITNAWVDVEKGKSIKPVDGGVANAKTSVELFFFNKLETDITYDCSCAALRDVPKAFYNFLL